MKRSNSGLSLVETMVAVSVGLIALLGFAMMFQQQAQQQRFLSRKFEALDLKQHLLTLLANPTACACNLSPAGSFNSTSLSGLVLNIPDLKAACPGAMIAQPGQLLPGSTSNLVVDAINITDITPVTTNVYKAFLNVRFAIENGTTPIAPIRMAQILSTDPSSPAHAKVINGCSASGSGFEIGGYFEECHTPFRSCPNAASVTGIVNCWQKNPVTNGCSCPPGFYAMSTGLSFHYDEWDGRGMLCVKY